MALLSTCFARLEDNILVDDTRVNLGLVDSVSSQGTDSMAILCKKPSGEK